MEILVTGGAGFMGSNFVRYITGKYKKTKILIYDKLTYAGRIENIKDLFDKERISFIKGDICDEKKFQEVIKENKPDIIVNFAAETHVDRSINEPAPFLRTNIFGLFVILETARKYETPLIIHISTDEVYGDMENKPPATEDTPFRPSSPYSASKASGDLLAQSYYRTYGLPIIILRPSNNYGPYQFPEKLIPKTIIRALHGYTIPIYGKGDQVRDWLYVEDFAKAVETVILKGRKGEAYNVPGFNEKTNLEVVKTILRIMNKPLSLIKHVEDRPGHDKRYAMRGDKILSLGWKPETPWIEGIRRTINWYISNEWWWKPLLSDDYFSAETPWRRKT